VYCVSTSEILDMSDILKTFFGFPVETGSRGYWRGGLTALHMERRVDTFQFPPGVGVAGAHLERV